MTHEEYLKEKELYAYSLYKQKKLFAKSRAIIIKGDKILLIRYVSKNKYRYQFPGGGVDDGETVFIAAERESEEEVNAKVNALKIVSKEFYNVNMKCNNIPFVSKRVEFFCLCNFINYNEQQTMGLDGEFISNWDTIGVYEMSIDEFASLKYYQISNLNFYNHEKILKACKKFIKKNKN